MYLSISLLFSVSQSKLIVTRADRKGAAIALNDCLGRVVARVTSRRQSLFHIDPGQVPESHLLHNCRSGTGHLSNSELYNEAIKPPQKASPAPVVSSTLSCSIGSTSTLFVNLLVAKMVALGPDVITTTRWPFLQSMSTFFGV